jgi:hypothetical protein
MKLSSELACTNQRQFGHVLGMIHEQCRSDRDDHIVYHCKDINGYGATFYKAMMAGEQDVDTHLCDEKPLRKNTGSMERNSPRTLGTLTLLDILIEVHLTLAVSCCTPPTRSRIRIVRRITSISALWCRSIRLATR